MDAWDPDDTMSGELSLISFFCVNQAYFVYSDESSQKKDVIIWEIERNILCKLYMLVFF